MTSSAGGAICSPMAPMPAGNFAVPLPISVSGPSKSSSVRSAPPILPRRWVVERTLAWLNRNRRLAKDFEASIASAKAWLIIVSVQLLARRVVYSKYNLSDSQSDT
jgi:hypothetical protein